MKGAFCVHTGVKNNQYKMLKRKWQKNQRAVVGAQRSNNTSFFFQY